MRVRRFVFTAALLASVVPTVAFAQDAQPSATVTAVAPPPPPPPTTQPNPGAQRSGATDVGGAQRSVRDDTDEQEPLRLGRFLELESQRAARQRYGSAVISMVGGALDAGIGIGTFAYLSSNGALNDPTNGALYTVIAVIPIVIGGLQFVGGVVDLFATTPMERLFETYAPIAIRSDLTPTQRLARGEALLMTAAESDRARRVMSAATSFLLGAVLTGFAIGFGVDNQIPQPDNAVLAVGLAGAALVSVIGGAGALWWERGPAEVAWEQWHAMHEHVVVHTEAKVRFAPSFAVIRGGATGGLSLLF